MSLDLLGFLGIHSISWFLRMGRIEKEVNFMLDASLWAKVVGYLSRLRNGGGNPKMSPT